MNLMKKTHFLLQAQQFQLKRLKRGLDQDNLSSLFQELRELQREQQRELRELQRELQREQQLELR